MFLVRSVGPNWLGVAMIAAGGVLVAYAILRSIAFKFAWFSFRRESSTGPRCVRRRAPSTATLFAAKLMVAFADPDDGFGEILHQALDERER